MSGMKVDIMWSPNHRDKFITLATDLSLYKVEPLTSVSQHKGMQVSEDSYASLLSVHSSPDQYMKCLAWYPCSQPDHLLAVGLANGKVLLQSFVKGGGSDPQELIGKEFVPKHARQCNYVAWNPIENNLLAEGLDKYRTDSSILVWDVNAKLSSQEGSTWTDPRRGTLAVNSSEAVRPFVELGTSEASLSLSWFSQAPRTLVTGMNKFLRIFDLRDIGHPQSAACTKAVYGVKVDPHFEYRLASYYDDHVAIWDTRNFDKPVLTLSETKPVSKIAWSPTRCGLLACLTKDTSAIKLYDIQQIPMGSDELEPAVIERMVQSANQQVVSSFDWHLQEENRMLTVTPAGVIKDIKIFERIVVDFSPDIYLGWACGRQLKQCNSVSLCQPAANDISIKMKRRALQGYGLHDEVQVNTKYVGDDVQLRNLWRWINHVTKLHTAQSQQLVPILHIQSLPATTPLPTYLGVKSILGLNEGTGMGARSDLEYWSWQGVDGQPMRSTKKVHLSEERSRALELCGWTAEKESPSMAIIDRLEMEKDYERAAAIAIFTLRLKRAIKVLVTGASISQDGNANLNMVAMALSGFSDERNVSWRELCSAQRKELKSPYLRAMFAFVTADDDSFYDIPNTRDLEVVDRVALACMYLPDNKLNEFIEKLTKMMISDGNLDGVLLTGLTSDGIDLLGKYIDNTADVQTVAMALVQAFPNAELAKDMRVQAWIESYRSLLDTWRLWHQRAEFDVYKNGRDKNLRAQSQVFVSCNFCGKSVSYNSLANRNRHLLYGSAIAHKSKISSCPACRKPLPRCALCLINMGTPSGTGKPISTNPPLGERGISKLTPLAEWFTWCQTCRHGGHTHHIIQWFTEQSECPVTGCSCMCMLLDPMANVSMDKHRASSVTS